MRIKEYLVRVCHSEEIEAYGPYLIWRDGSKVLVASADYTIPTPHIGGAEVYYDPLDFFDD